jgi:hypothetical protein
MSTKTNLGHVGLNHVTFNTEEDSRLVDWNDRRNKERREKNEKNLPFYDPLIAEFEEKRILDSVVAHQKETPVDLFGEPCPECKAVRVDIVVPGCACVSPVLDQKKVSSNEIQINHEGATRKQNRIKACPEKKNIGKGGYDNQTSPHLTNKGWKPAAAVVQKLNVGTKEAHWGDPLLQKKLSDTGSLKVRKNTIAKVSKLEERKETRKTIGQLKGKIE